MLKEVQYYYMLHTPICKYPSIAQLVERWTVVGKHMTDIHRSLVRIRFEGVLLHDLALLRTLNFIVKRYVHTREVLAIPHHAYLDQWYTEWEGWSVYLL